MSGTGGGPRGPNSSGEERPVEAHIARAVLGDYARRRTLAALEVGREAARRLQATAEPHLPTARRAAVAAYDAACAQLARTLRFALARPAPEHADAIVRDVSALHTATHGPRGDDDS